MAAQNLSVHEQQQTVGDLTCSPDFSPGLNGQLIFLSVVNAFMSVTTFLGNALILIALHKESSIHPPSKLLLRSLATTDLCVGLTSEPLTVICWMSVANGHWNICRYTAAVGCTAANIFCGVSVLTLAAISVDRLLALLLGLRYRQVVTLKRTYVIVITFWMVSTVVSAIRFWNRLVVLWCGIIISSLCLVISTFSYTKIFFTLRHHQNQVQDHVQQPNQTNQLNIARYKKALSTALWLQLTLVACYLPYCIEVASRQFSTLHPSATIYTGTLIFLNSSLNPILYCWKIEEVRQAVKDTIRQVLCLCFSS